MDDWYDRYIEADQRVERLLFSYYFYERAVFVGFLVFVGVLVVWH